MGENRTKSLESLLEDVDVIAGSLELNLPFVGRGHVKPGETETVAQVKLRRHQDFFRDAVLSILKVVQNGHDTQVKMTF